MANLPNHLYGSATRVEKRRGSEKRSQVLKHLVAACPRCKAEREIARAKKYPQYMMGISAMTGERFLVDMTT